MKSLFYTLIVTLSGVMLLLAFSKPDSKPVDLMPEGQEARYKISFSVYGEQKGGLGSIISGSGRSGLSLSGSVTVRQVSSGGDNNLYEFLIVPEEFDYYYETELNQGRYVKSDMKFLADWNQEDGFVRFFGDNLLRENEYLIRSFLDVVQFNNDPDSRAWDKTFEGLYGKIRQKFERSMASYLPFSPSNCISKSRKEEKDLETSGKIDFCFNESGLISVSGHKTERYLKSGELISTRESMIEVALTESKDVVASSDVNTADMNEYYYDGRFARKRLQDRLDKNNLSGRNYQELIQEILSPEKIKISDQANLAGALAAYIRLHPESADEIAKLLYSYSREDDAYGIIISALSASGTQQAKLALMAFSGTRNGDEKTQAYFSISIMDNADKESVDFFRNSYQRGESDALFALGIVGDKLTNPDEKKVVSDFLMELHRESRSIEQKKAIIRAIANTRDESFSELVVYDLKNEKGLRFEAISALGDIRSDISKNALLEQLEDKSEHVKVISLRSLGQYDLTSELLGVYKSAIYSESEFVRLEALNNLSKHKGEARVKEFALRYQKDCPTAESCDITKDIIDY